MEKLEKYEKLEKWEKWEASPRVSHWAGRRGTIKSMKSASQPKGPPLGRTTKSTKTASQPKGPPLGQKLKISGIGIPVLPWAGSSKSLKSVFQPKGTPLDRKLKITQIGLPAQGSPLGPEAKTHSNRPSSPRVPPWVRSLKINELDPLVQRFTIGLGAQYQSIGLLVQVFSL